MEIFWQDIKYGFRMLMRKPAFTAIALLALTVGIGANTAIFSVVKGVLLNPLPYEEPTKLVHVWNQMRNEGLPQLWLSEPELLYYRENQQALEGIAVFTTRGANLTGRGEALRTTVSYVSDNLFPILRTEPLHGRNFTEEEDQPGNNQVVILEHGFWQRNYGGDPGIVGEAVTLNQQPYTVIGIMPEGFHYPPAGQDMWSPIAMDAANPRGAGSHYLQAIGRLKPGVSFQQGLADIHRTTLQYVEFNTDYFGDNAKEAIEQFGWDAYLVPLHDSMVGDVRPALLVLLGAVGFVLLIACANVANLLLARAATREKEVAIRVSMGASRGRIVRQLLTESVLLALSGGVMGLVLAFWGVQAIVALGLENLPRQETIAIDPGVLLFTLAVSLFTGLIFGLVPALHSSKTDLHESLKEGGRGSGTGGGRLLRSSLVVVEVAVAVVLLIGAGLLIQSFVRTLAVDAGFRTDNLLTLQISLPQARYTDDQQIDSFYSQLLEKIQALPGVKSAGSTFLLPLSGQGASGTVSVESASPAYVPNSRERNFPYVETDYRTASPGYFQAMGMTLKEGRLLKESDNPQAPLVALVDESFARRFWPDESPLGKRLVIGGGGGDNPPWRTIVGVVQHVKYYGLAVEGREQIYVSSAQFAVNSRYLAIHTATDPNSLINSVRAQVREMDPELPVFDIRTMEERLGDTLAQARFNVMLLGLFAAVAMALSSVGVYGVVAYAVSQRTHEIGIRMALGAQPRDVAKMVLTQGMTLILLGTAVGLAGAFALTRLLTSLLFGVSATDPWTFLGVPLLLAMIALLACYIPARRATQVDPMVALRYE